MLQLTGTEARLILQEAGRSPQHISPLMIYDPSTAPLQQVRYRDILDSIRRSLHRAGLFRRKLVKTPLNLDYPYWVEDEHFDLDYHIRHIALPRPGNWAQLRKLLGRLHAVPLDTTRPLWEVYVIEGLADIEDYPEGSFALLFKLHIAVMERSGLSELVSAIHTTTPMLPATENRDNWLPDPAPAAWQLLSKAYMNGFRRPAKLLKMAGDTTNSLLSRVRNREQAVPSQHDPSRSRFNSPISAERVTGSICFGKPELQAIARAVPGSTSIDVLGAVVGGGLRRYLTDKGELPGESLSAATPVQRTYPRQVAADECPLRLIKLELGTNIEAPIERLQWIHAMALQAEATPRSKSRQTSSSEARGPEHQNEAFCLHDESLPSVLERNPIPFNVFLAQSQGPQSPLYLSGANLQSLMILGNVMDNIGLSHTVTTCRDTITMTFVACRDMLPDPEFYTDCLSHSLVQLRLAAMHSEHPQTRG